MNPPCYFTATSEKEWKTPSLQNNLKIKLSVTLHNLESRLENVWRSGDIDTRILDTEEMRAEQQLSIRLAVVNFTRNPFQSFMFSRLTFNATPANNTHK
jgi:hypothetical protein